MKEEEEYIEKEEELEEKPPKRARLDLLLEFIRKTQLWYQLVEGKIDEKQLISQMSSRKRKKSKKK